MKIILRAKRAQTICLLKACRELAMGALMRKVMITSSLSLGSRVFQMTWPKETEGLAWERECHCIYSFRHKELLTSSRNSSSQIFTLPTAWDFKVLHINLSRQISKLKSIVLWTGTSRACLRSQTFWRCPLNILLKWSVARIFGLNAKRLCTRQCTGGLDRTQVGGKWYGNELRMFYKVRRMKPRYRESQSFVRMISIQKARNLKFL